MASCSERAAALLAFCSCCSYFMLSKLYVFLSHLVSRAGCGIRLYQFLIVAFSSTLDVYIWPLSHKGTSQSTYASKPSGRGPEGTCNKESKNMDEIKLGQKQFNLYHKSHILVIYAHRNIKENPSNWTTNLVQDSLKNILTSSYAVSRRPSGTGKESILWLLKDNFQKFAIKTYFVGTH